MRKVIIGMNGCMKCKTLKEQNPDAEYVEVAEKDMVNLLVFARIANIQSMPFLVVVGEPQELDKQLKVEVL